MGNWGDLEKRKKEKALGIWARDSESLLIIRGGYTIRRKCRWIGHFGSSSLLDSDTI
ncbi:MAG: hypothetical protein J6O61_05255 [Butyrivibrio sp.]|uniref:hypothetical protein n=1 Tax=Butyrivibrio sp. TaxID=28121 RepID=UPI001B179FF6|nr:hypothetical protein [Butyrivibrio sp.]MBO6240233.1 hypothetical protein [Butyrivibrio sp.]